MAEKFLQISSDGQRQEENEALQTSAGAADAGKIPALNAEGKIDETMLYNVEAEDRTAFENISAGDLVYVRSDGQLAKADATTSGKEAMGFVKTAITAATTGKVYYEGKITGLSGLTPGAKQFLSTTAGGVTETAPAATGNIWQIVGRASSATEIIFEAQDGILRA